MLLGNLGLFSLECQFEFLLDLNLLALGVKLLDVRVDVAEINVLFYRRLNLHSQSACTSPPL